MTLRRAAFLAIFVALLSLTGCAVHPGKVPAIVSAGDTVPKIVQIADGALVGGSTSAGQAFLGIPFAAPPVGPLRWRPPQPVAPWSGSRDATHIQSGCLQSPGFGLVLGDEDCLYLNIYTPPAAALRPDQRWPTMVFIPGGAFVLGAGDNYDPSRLATFQGVIVITVNYRLGALGFLAHPALRAENPGGGSGNFGLMDQQAALRWVQDNIAAFDGVHRM
jgi:para-nitrobenzyl esterase